MQVHSVLLLRVSSEVDKEVDHPQFFDPSYPLKYIQAGLARYPGVMVQLLDCWIQPLSVAQMVTQARRVQPDLIVISASSFEIDVANQLARSIKNQADPPLLVGIGQGYYLARDFRKGSEKSYDAVLLGEPEQEFFCLFDQILDSSNGWREYYRQCYAQGRRFLVEDPDDLPFPTYSREELQAYKSIYPVQVSRPVVWGFLTATRGCPHGCVFCSEVMRVSIGRRLRSRSPANVADEMAHLARLGVNICSFQDDSFSANRKFVRSLCRELIARGSKMPWMARVRVDELDYELLVLMKKAGCVMLGMGVESGSERVIRTMNKQQKNRSWRQLCLTTFNWTRKLGIGTNAYYVIGNPGETRAEIEETIRFACRLNSDSIQVHYFTAYPGSAAWEKYKHRFNAHDPAHMFHYATPMFSLARVSVAQLEELRSKFYRRYLFRPEFAIRHILRYGIFYWHNPDIFRSLLGIRKVL
jgi:anaerobic magnesium-protoporphyrin IX monomethyl ester cyclase